MDSGNLYIADTWNNRIQKVNAKYESDSDDDDDPPELQAREDDLSSDEEDDEDDYNDEHAANEILYEDRTTGVHEKGPVQDEASEDQAEQEPPQNLRRSARPRAPRTVLEPTMTGLRQKLTSDCSLMRLRQIADAHLYSLPPPVGFGPRVIPRKTRQKQTQHNLCPDHPP